MKDTKMYVSAFSLRYASKQMQYIFSQQKKFSTWRKLWIALAETERELGLSENGRPVITKQMIEEMKKYVEDINFEDAEKREALTRHDVMSHIYAYGLQCPSAAGIIHLGATSCYVGDNTDLILMKEALSLIRKQLVNLINTLGDFAEKYKSLPTLAYTHFQPAQPTTVGKRAVLWINEFVMDLEDLDYVLSGMKLLGCKGTTGTQASFVKLFDGDEKKICQIDQKIAEKMGFEGCYPVSGQTYSRKIDTKVMNVLAGIGASAYKFSNDLRLLQHLREIEEPFESEQIGSSAMAYKRNPMRSERIASLSRFLITDSFNSYLNSSSQWFERTLDDSADRRITIPEGFMAADGILNLCINVSLGLTVNEKIIQKHLDEQMPFMITENILMETVKKGGDRQKLHEKIRVFSLETAERVKRGDSNDLLERIAADPDFAVSIEELMDVVSADKYIGRADKQTEEYLKTVVEKIRKDNKELLGMKAQVSV